MSEPMEEFLSPEESKEFVQELLGDPTAAESAPPPIDLRLETEKERTIRRKIRNLSKRVTQGRMTHSAFRMRVREVVDEVLK